MVGQGQSPMSQVIGFLHVESKYDVFYIRTIPMQIASYCSIQQNACEKNKRENLVSY